MVELARDGPVSPAPAPEPGGEEPAGSSSAGGLGNALRLVATVGSPIAITTGLLFYFGWVRASVQARQLGYDVAILMLLLIWVDQRLVVPAADAGRLASWLPRGLRGSWLLWLPVAVALSVVAASLSGIVVSAAVTLALLCALYGDLLERRLTGRTRTSPPAKVLILVLLAFAVFWNVERMAHVVGEEYAAQITANPRQLLAVTIYSPKSLEIHLRGVQETRLGNPESAYRYRYDGLRLVQRSGDRYLLMSEQWDARSARIVVLRDSDSLRLEFTRS